MFHVSSVLNRESIRVHGLDWERMAEARGLAGSGRPEVDGIFLAPDLGTARWIVRLNNTGGAVDIWSVDGVDPDDLLNFGNGYHHVPYRLGPHRVTLHERALVEQPPPPRRSSDEARRNAFSSLTITLDDGTELHGQAAWIHLAELAQRSHGEQHDEVGTPER